MSSLDPPSRSSSSKSVKSPRRQDSTTSTSSGSSTPHKSSSGKSAATKALEQIYAAWPATVPQHRVGLEAAPVETVTVFGDRAEVTRRVAVEVEAAGVHEVVVRGFGERLNAKSVRAAAASDEAAAPVLLEVSYESKQERRPRLENDAARALQQEVEQLTAAIPKLEAAVARLEKERSALQRYRAAITAAPMTAAGLVSLTDAAGVGALRGFLEVYQRRSEQLAEQVRALNDDLRRQRERLASVRRELAARDANPWIQETWRDVAVTLFAPAAGRVEFALSYITEGARWRSSYEVRVDSATRKLDLLYYGTIEQATGEHWNGVKLRLSTAAPAVGGDAPELPAAVIRIDRPVQIYVEREYAKKEMSHDKAKSSRSRHAAAPRSSAASGAIAMASYAEDEDEYNGPVGAVTTTVAPPEPMQQLTAEVEQSEFSTTWTIPRPATIESDNKPHKVTIRIASFAADFVYVVLPSQSTRAYLKASARNDAGVPFPSGPAAIFFDNAFVTQSHLKAVGIADSLETFLGTDSAVKVSYSGQQPTSSSGGGMLSGRTTVKEMASTTTVKNLKQVPIDVLVRDYLPRSEEEKIRIALLEPSADDLRRRIASLDEDTDHLEWRFRLEPGTDRLTAFRFRMEWPQDRNIKFKHV